MSINIWRYISIHELTAFAVLILLGSCTGETKKATPILDDENQEEYLIYQMDESTYKIPSPMELFLFLESNGGEFVKESLHDVSKQNAYMSRKDKSLNLGIYSADLAYSTVFGDFQQTLTYFSAAKSLATDLGLHEGFGEQITERIDKNLTNIDSLINITSDSYEEVNLFLEDQGLADILGYIVAGGWIESLYLSIQSTGTFHESNPLIERIADQQILLDNLLQFLRKYSENTQILEVITQLEELQEVYDQLYYNDDNTIITKEQFVAVSNKVIEIRETIIH